MQTINNKITNDIFLKDYIYEKYSKSFYGYLKSSNATFYLNNIKVDINSYLKSGDIFKIEYLNKINNTIKVDKEVDIIYEDEYIIIIDKPHDLLTIPSIKEIDSLYSRLINIRENINIITRLDKATAGLVLVSKKSFLVDTINSNILCKEYIAKTSNLLPNKKGIIELPIKKSDTIKRVVDEKGKMSITQYELIDKNNFIYKLNLITGRTHQIRVHLSYYNCAVVGDELYNGIKDNKLNLICKKLQVKHPITNDIIEIESKYELR